jgi:hypothetical protein
MAHAPSAAWLDRFTVRLEHLLPSVTIDEAADIALTTYVDASDFTPEDAADIYAAELPPGGEGTPE